MEKKNKNILFNDKSCSEFCRDKLKGIFFVLLDSEPNELPITTDLTIVPTKLEICCNEWFIVETFQPIQ